MKLLNYYKYLFALSGIILILGILSLAIYGLHLDVDFKGGTLTELEFKQAFDQNKVKDVLSAEGLTNFQLQTSGEKGLLIKTEALDKERHDKIEREIKKQVGEFEEKRFDSIGPV